MRFLGIPQDVHESWKQLEYLYEIFQSKFLQNVLSTKETISISIEKKVVGECGSSKENEWTDYSFAVRFRCVVDYVLREE